MPIENNGGVLAGEVVNTPFLRKSALGRFFTTIELKVVNTSSNQSNIIRCVAWDSDVAKDAVNEIHRGDYVQLDGYLHRYEYVDKNKQKQQIYQLVFNSYDICTKPVSINKFYLEGYMHNCNPAKFIKNKLDQEAAILKIDFSDINRDSNFSEISLFITKPSIVQELKGYHDYGDLTCKFKAELCQETPSPVGKPYWLNVNEFCRFISTPYDPIALDEVGLGDGYDPLTD